MPNDNVKKWVAALRSGEYTKGRGQLHNGNTNSYCCLGVACMVYQKDRGDLDIVIGSGDYAGSTFNGEVTSLPHAVQQWLGLSSVEGDYGDGTESLIGLNDTGGYPFETIADIIESTPAGLFEEER